jgi:hypothetical protein
MRRCDRGHPLAPQRHRRESRPGRGFVGQLLPQLSYIFPHGNCIAVALQRGRAGPSAQRVHLGKAGMETSHG